MSIICLTRGLSLIGFGVIWLLSMVCLLLRINASFLCYTDYLNFIKDDINHILQKPIDPNSSTLPLFCCSSLLLTCRTQLAFNHSCRCQSTPSEQRPIIPHHLHWKDICCDIHVSQSVALLHAEKKEK